VHLALNVTIVYLIVLMTAVTPNLILQNCEFCPQSICTIIKNLNNVYIKYKLRY